MDADQVSDLGDDLTPGLLLAQHERRHADDEDQPGCERKDHVVRKGRPESRRAVLVPFAESLGEQLDDAPEHRRHPLALLSHHHAAVISAGAWSSALVWFARTVSAASARRASLLVAIGMTFSPS